MRGFLFISNILKCKQKTLSLTAPCFLEAWYSVVSVRLVTFFPDTWIQFKHFESKCQAKQNSKSRSTVFPGNFSHSGLCQLGNIFVYSWIHCHLFISSVSNAVVKKKTTASLGVPCCPWMVTSLVTFLSWQMELKKSFWFRLLGQECYQAYRDHWLPTLLKTRFS